MKTLLLLGLIGSVALGSQTYASNDTAKDMLANSTKSGTVVGDSISVLKSLQATNGQVTPEIKAQAESLINRTAIDKFNTRKNDVVDSSQVLRRLMRSIIEGKVNDLTQLRNAEIIILQSLPALMRYWMEEQDKINKTVRDQQEYQRLIDEVVNSTKMIVKDANQARDRSVRSVPEPQQQSSGVREKNTDLLPN